jgi:hypothetical protein
MPPDDDRCKDVVSSLAKVQNKKKGKLYEHARKFQDVWIAHLPWVELVFDEKGQVLGLLYGVYICGREDKLLIFKLNNLLKHQGHHKAKVPCPRLMSVAFTTTKALSMRVE